MAKVAALAYYDHMSTTPSTSHCPFCLANHLLKTPIIAENSAAFLIPALGSNRNYLIVPKQHAETPGELPAHWWENLTELLGKVPGPTDHYNISINIGAQAGQTVKHLHFWIIPRGHTHAASGKGLATLIDAATQE